MHRLGQLAEAEAGYRQVLKKRPALHVLGVCEHQSGDSEAADQPFGTDVSGSFGPAAPCHCRGAVLMTIHVCALYGGAMVARPLMPAISSGAAPTISPITLID